MMVDTAVASGDDYNVPNDRLGLKTGGNYNGLWADLYSWAGMVLDSRQSWRINEQYLFVADNVGSDDTGELRASFSNLSCTVYYCAYRWMLLRDSDMYDAPLVLVLVQFATHAPSAWTVVP